MRDERTGEWSGVCCVPRYDEVPHDGGDLRPACGLQVRIEEQQGIACPHMPFRFMAKVYSLTLVGFALQPLTDPHG